MKVFVKDITGGNNAIYESEGNCLYWRLEDRIINGNGVKVSFKGIDVITHEFLNASIGRICSNFDRRLLKQKLEILDTKESHRDFFKAVIIAGREYYKKKEEIKKKFFEK
jgi:hypothetical protein